MKVVVVDLANLGIPLLLFGNDGNKPVPAGGILLLSEPPKTGSTARSFTTFPSIEEAQDAIDRSVEHGKAHGYGETWAPHMHKIVPLAEYLDSLTRKRRKIDKAAQADHDISEDA